MKTYLFGLLAGLLLLSAAPVRADSLKYGMSVGNPVIYQVTLTTEMPEGNKSVTGYLLYKPQSVDATNGQVKLSCFWGVPMIINSNTVPPAFLSKDELAKPGGGAEIVIDKLGNIVRIDSAAGKSQLGDALGPAGELMLQPLPPANQTTWSTRRNISLYYEKKTQVSGPWGRPQDQVTRVETPAEETVTFTAAPVEGGKQVIRRSYNLASLEKTGDTPVHQIVGDGFYSFNSSIGAIETCEYKFTSMVNQKNVSVKIPITLSAKLVAADELTKMQDELAERQKAFEQETKRREVDRKEQAKHPDNRDTPSGMAKTELFGHLDGGSPYLLVDPDHRPVLGFRITYGDWMGKKSIRNFDPLYEKTSARDGETIVMANEGYVVGAVTITGENSIDNLYITFMKRTDKGLDVNTKYNSSWYGTDLKKPRIKLGGDGKLVYGTFGRKGLNMDAIGLVVQSSDAKDEPAKEGHAKDEPAKDEPAKDEPAKDEPAKDEPAAGAAAGESKIVNTIPADMKKSDLAGLHPEQGGNMVQVNSRNLPMIGVKYVTADVMGHKAFRVFEPVFEVPKDKKAGDVYVLAKDGYVVTSITVNPMPDNGTPGVPALYLTFAKLNGDKLDLTTQYNSPWLGERVGEARKTVGTRGQIVYGICGRHGMNLDCLGVVIKSSPAKN